MLHVLPYMMYFTSLVKILLRVTDLNIANKIPKTPEIAISGKRAKIVDKILSSALYATWTA